MSTSATHNEPPAVEKSGPGGPPVSGIFIRIELPLFFVWGDAALVISISLEKNLCRALCDKRIQTPDTGKLVARGCNALGVFTVTDLSAGLDAIRDELAELKALAYSEIGYLDYKTGTWHMWYPRNSAEPFSKNLDLLKQWIEQSKRNSPQ